MKQEDDMHNLHTLDPDQFGGEDFPPLTTPEEEETIRKFYKENSRILDVHAFLSNVTNSFNYTVDLNDDNWIQTYSGIRFTPLNPQADAVTIQDMAHSLSMQCRFGGHCNEFYSVAQHCVLVSYICDYKDREWGTLHDGSETYTVDIPRPLKHSPDFCFYRQTERKNQDAICTKFGLSLEEPESVKKADNILLATEVRDLMAPIHPDFELTEKPLPFKIVPLPPKEAKELFLKRFFEVFGYPEAYSLYLNSNIKR